MPQSLRSWLRDRLSWDPCLLVDAWSRIVLVVVPEDKMKVDLDQTIIVRQVGLRQAVPPQVKLVFRWPVVIACVFGRTVGSRLLYPGRQYA